MLTLITPPRNCPYSADGIVGDDVEFLDGVDIRREGDVVVDELVVVHAVQQVVIGLLAVAVDVRPAGVEGLLAGVEGAGAGGYRARREQRQLVVVAGFQRQVPDGARLHDGANVVDSVCSNGAAPVTSTLCDTSPSVMAISILAVWFRSRLNAGRTAV